MTLRRLERLLSEARLSSNTQDVDTVTDALLVFYANRVQSMIEDKIFLSNSANNLFMGQVQYTIVANQTNYDLPFDIYAKNAIKSVNVVRTSTYGFLNDKVPFISESESGNKYGYVLSENQIVFNLQRNISDPVRVNYDRKIPSLGKRLGAAITAAGSGTVTVGTTTENILDIDDYFSTVDINGVIKTRNNRVLTYTPATGVLTFTLGTSVPDTATNIPANGQYVIPGKYATSHSQLPDECEKIFLEVLERRIAQRQSQTDLMSAIAPLTAQEEALIDAVFAKASDDNLVPPIVDYVEFS